MGGGIRRGTKSSAASRDEEAAQAFEKDKAKPLEEYDSARGALMSNLDDNRDARVIVNAAVGFAAASNPTVASVVTAYHAGKICWKVANAYNEELEQTHSREKAFHAAKDAVVEETKKEVQSQLIGAVVDSSLFPSNDKGTARFTRELAKSIADEELGDMKKKGRRSRH